MSKHEKTEPSFFKWIRAARAEIRRDTAGMTAQEHVAYIHAKAREARLDREILASGEIKSETIPQ